MIFFRKQYIYRRVKKINFNWPSHATLNARSSTISNAFIQTLTPWITEKEEKGVEVYTKYCEENNGCNFNMSRCFYCGAPASSSDHIVPLVSERRPTGAITEIYNLVPCCSTCNSSKGNKTFEEWYNETTIIDVIKENMKISFEEAKEIFDARRRTIPQLFKELQDANPRKDKMNGGKYKCYIENTKISKKLIALMAERDALIAEIKTHHKKCLDICSLIEKEILPPEEYIANRFSRIVNDVNKIYKYDTASTSPFSKFFSENFLKENFNDMKENELRIVKGTSGLSKLDEKYFVKSKTILGKQYHYAFCVSDENGMEEIDDKLAALEKTVYIY